MAIKLKVEVTKNGMRIWECTYNKEGLLISKRRLEYKTPEDRDRAIQKYLNEQTKTRPSIELNLSELI